jgi:hypothetical protein
LFACSSPSPEEKIPGKNDSIPAVNSSASGSIDSSLPPDVEIPDTAKAEVIVKDQSAYSKKFIDGLEKHSGYKKFELTGNKIIAGGNDTASFPETPAIGESFKLTGRKGELVIALIIKRINYTTIDYSIEMVEFGKANYSRKGQAHLHPLFFLGSESDHSSLTGNDYFSTEFWDIEEDDCRISIRLGKEDSGKQLLGKLISNCNGKIEAIRLDSFPTLVEK